MAEKAVARTVEEEEAAARQKMQEYDYMRLTWHDLYGAPRTRIVPGRHADRVIPAGFGVYEGALYVGPRSEMSDELHHVHLERLGSHSGNIDCIPDPSTIHAVAWAGAEKYKVGEMLCNLVKKDGSILPNLPRRVAEVQLARLDKLGMKFMSAYELEFTLEDRKTHEPVFDEPDIFSPLFFAEHEKMLFELDQQMLESGVQCEMFQTEFGPGQFEITMVPVFGIDGGDKAITLKQGLKEIAHKYGLEATFLPKRDPKASGTGAHFNFSVWKKEGKTNVFYDPEDPLKLSAFARHWIAGLMHHGRAISALQSPTVNCYRRLQGDWAPSKVSWGMENRNASLRVKADSPSRTYMENRLPSGSANYYLVLAATIAAGLSGVEKKMEPPAEGIENSETLPLTLAEALTVFEQDKELVEALGCDFVDWFCLVKRMVDIATLKDSDMANPTPEQLAKERHMYNITI